MAYSIDAKTNNITLVRGDYFPCNIAMTKDGEPFTPVSGSLRFALKKRYTDADDKVLIVKPIPLTTLLLELESEDTKDLKFGDYVYEGDAHGHNQSHLKYYLSAIATINQRALVK